MSASNYDVMIPELWENSIQDWLNPRLIAEEICNMKWPSLMNEGDTVHWNAIPDFRNQAYTPGTDLTIDTVTAIDSTLVVNRSRAATAYIDPTQTKQIAAKEYVAKGSKQAAYTLARELDNHVLATGVAGVASGNSVSGTITLSSSNIFQYAAQLKGILAESNAVDGELFLCVNPTGTAKMAQAGVVNGFQLADDVLMKGISPFYAKFDGFRIYETNCLPTTVTLDLVNIPTAGETFTLHGVTFTWAAAGAATNAGDIAIGANVAAARANFLLAIAGTATGSASTYIDLSSENRRKLQNAGLAASAFATNTTTLTSTGSIRASETMADAANVFGTETTTFLAGRLGAIACARQMAPSVYFKDEPKQLGQNMIAHQLYGDAVFSRDAYRLAKMTVVNAY